MKTCMALLMMLSLLAGPVEEASPAPGAGWQETVEAVLAADTEEKIDAAARTLLDWAAFGETCQSEQVAQLLEEKKADDVEAALRYAAVLDAADALLETGEESVEAETYHAAARTLVPLFTRLLERETTPWQWEAAAYPKRLEDFEGIWCDGVLKELLIFRDGKCRVVIPYLDYYGETAHTARLRDRSELNYCPALQVDTYDSGNFSGALTYYVSGLAEDHFWCNTQRQRFERVA